MHSWHLWWFLLPWYTFTYFPYSLTFCSYFPVHSRRMVTVRQYTHRKPDRCSISLSPMSGWSWYESNWYHFTFQHSFNSVTLLWLYFIILGVCETDSDSMNQTWAFYSSLFHTWYQFINLVRYHLSPNCKLFSGTVNLSRSTQFFLFPCFLMFFMYSL